MLRTKNMQKTIEHPIIGRIELRKTTRNKNIRLSVKSSGKILITLPYFTRYQTALKFMESRISWIIQAQQRASEKEKTREQNRVIDRSDKASVETLRKKAREYLPIRLDYFAGKHGFRYNRLFLKNNCSNWGSCSAKGNINLNITLVLLPQELSDYIILHELCHLKYPNHGREFHTLLNSLCEGREKEYAKKLKEYRL